MRKEMMERIIYNERAQYDESKCLILFVACTPYYADRYKLFQKSITITPSSSSVCIIS